MISHKGYLVQFLRKSKLLASNTNLAKYLNNVFLNLIVSNSLDYKIVIHGACWGRLGKNKSNSPCNELVKEVFDGVSKDVEIVLKNQYPNFTPDHIKKALQNYQFKNVTKSNKTRLDHAKLVDLYYKEENIFSMIGSSNFSRSSYLPKSPIIDQCEVAFIKATPKNKGNFALINHIINETNDRNRELLNQWRDLIEIPNSGNDLNVVKDIWKDIKIPTFTYIGAIDDEI